MTEIMKKYGFIIAVIFFSLFYFDSTVVAMDAVLTWSANTEADLAGYKIYVGIASRIYGTPIDVGKQTSYSVTGLPDQTHYFAVTAYNTSGEESGFSAEVSKTPVAAPDTTAPLLSSINASSITSNGATITWGTNEPTDTQVQYGTTTAYGSSTPRVTTLLTVHSQILTGLQPGTLYHYRVLSRDAAGNLATSLDNTFTTAVLLPPPPSSTPGTSATVRLSPAADTFLNVDTSANGTETTLNTYTWPANRIANAVLMQFNLSGLPAGAVIQSATLNLSLVEADTTSDAAYSIGVHKLINRNPDLTRATGATYDGTNAWTANTCCFNNYPLAQADISEAYDTEAVNKTLGNKVWDITAMVREWMSNPSSNFGLLVNSDATKGADRYRTFASMEHPTASLRPYLSVTYSASTADTSAPTVPTGLTATAASSSQINLSWNASTDNVGVTGYRIYRNGTQVGTTTLLNYSNAGLAADTAYSYTIAAYDEAGNLSAQSAAVSTRTLPPPDTTAPVISGIAAGSITANGALISWSTNEAADTQVEYGTTTAYGTSTPIVSILVTAHSQSLTGLNPATLYHYRVRSRDAAGNLAISVDGTFTTANTPDTTAPSVPMDLIATAVSSSQINLSWSASTDNVGVAGYRVYRNGIQIGTAASTSYASSGLTASTIYNYTVSAYDAAGNASPQSASVSAGTLPPPDTAPPVISGMAAGSITANSALISWSTDEPADTQIEYGTTTAYGTSTAIISTLVVSHSQGLTGLLPSTLYHYRVRSQDSAGNLTISVDGTFTTLASPDTTPPSAPTGLTANAASSSRIDLSWAASTDNIGVIGYRIYRNGAFIGTTASRSYSDTGLQSDTTYNYAVAAYDAAGNVSAQSAVVSERTDGRSWR